MKGLTERQKQLLDYIDNYQKTYKVMPTFVEMKEALGLKTIGAVQARMTPIIRKGYMERKNIYVIK